MMQRFDIDFVSKAFASIIEEYFILYNDVCAIIPECLSGIRGEIWEELIAQVINLGHFCVFKPTVRIIKPIRFWAAPNYYKLCLLVYKATLTIVLT